MQKVKRSGWYNQLPFDVEFLNGKALRSSVNASDTLLAQARDVDGASWTTFITLTSANAPSCELDVCTLDTCVGKGTWTASGTWTLPAFTAGGTITIGANLGDTVRRAVDNDLIAFGGGTDSGSPYWQMNGKSRGANPGAVYLYTPNAALAETTRMTFSQAADTISLTWNAVYHIGMKFGLAGTATGAFTMDGATSGVVTVKVAAAAGTWTMTLPATTGTVGQQLATDGAGICSWTDAASRREFKNIVGEHSPQDALDKILNTRVYDFHYKEGKGTGDRDTLYTGIMADEAPWAMHYQGGVVNPVNTLGFMVLGFQAHEERIRKLEQKG